MSKPTIHQPTIRAAWDDYRAKVIPHDAGATQLQESRRAFYAGAESLMLLILTGLSEGPETTPSDETWIAAMHGELHQFARDVKAGKA
jgi:hypothetical protein